MNLLKRTSAGLLICLVLYGCGFLAAPGQKVSKYCPGLNLKINGVNIWSTESRKITVVQYEDSYQGKVDAYFGDKSKGYGVGNPREYLDLKNGEDHAVSEGDSILTATVLGTNVTGTVIYNATTKRIIIIEPKY